jgi:hypothetical protein
MFKHAGARHAAVMAVTLLSLLRCLREEAAGRAADARRAAADPGATTRPPRRRNRWSSRRSYASRFAKPGGFTVAGRSTASRR